MKEEDIDKLFRENLGSATAPTTDQDWAAFEKGLKKRSGFLSPKFLIGALVLLAGMCTGIYYLGGFSAETDGAALPGRKTAAAAGPRVSKSETTPTISKESEKITKDGQDKGVNKNSLKPIENNASKAPSFVADEKATGTKPKAEPAVPTSLQRLGITRNGAEFEIDEKTTAYEAPDDRMVSGKAENMTSEKKETTRPSAVTDMLVESITADQNVSKANAELQRRLNRSPGDFKAMKPSALEGENRALVESLGLFKMTPKRGQIELELGDQNVQGAIEPLGLRTRHRFVPFMYVKAEQNLILGTSMGIGLGVEMPFSQSKNWTKNLGIGLGIGYMRSGTLRWNQNARDVFYGFDRYETSAQLSTQRLDLLQVPIHINYYFKGVHSVFAGLESSFVVNAAQELSTRSAMGDDTHIERGFLHATDAPNYIYFLQAGYGYGLHERCRIQVGGAFSNQNWNTSTRPALGAFLKLNFQLR